MKARLKHIIGAGAALGAWSFIVNGCSTSEVKPTPIPSPPMYLQAPHPVGPDTADIEAIFNDKIAPKPDELKNCDAEFRKLREVTPSEEEFRRGVGELVRVEPLKFHWCFYQNLVELNQFLKNNTFIDERQKHTLRVFEFLSPIARAYMTEFHDSRYMRIAIRHYRRISEYVFFRKLELSPQGTSELVDAATPFALHRPAMEADLILDKYNIRVAPLVGAAAAPSGAPAVSAAAAPSGAPAVSAAAAPSGAPAVSAAAPSGAPAVGAAAAPSGGPAVSAAAPPSGGPAVSAAAPPTSKSEPAPPTTITSVAPNSAATQNSAAALQLSSPSTPAAEVAPAASPDRAPAGLQAPSPTQPQASTPAVAPTK